MIYVWYLVIFYGAAGAYGRGVDHIPFGTKEDCVAAETQIEQQAGGGVYYACVEGVIK